MASEQLVEKPAPESLSEKKLHKIEQTEMPDRSFENTDSAIERPPEPVKLPQRVNENDIIAVSQVHDYQQQRSKAIDSILSEGLDEVFLGLKPDKQKEFKVKGEETVKEINTLLSKTKVKVSKIIGLIKSWLKIIPGVNKFFLEQESKIKADKIMEIKNKF